MADSVVEPEISNGNFLPVGVKVLSEHKNRTDEQNRPHLLLRRLLLRERRTAVAATAAAAAASADNGSSFTANAVRASLDKALHLS